MQGTNILSVQVVHGMQVIIDEAERTIQIVEPLVGSQEEIASTINKVCQEVIAGLSNSTISKQTIVSLHPKKSLEENLLFSFPSISKEKVPTDIDKNYLHHGYKRFSVIYDTL